MWPLEFQHKSVLLQEAVEALSISPEGIYIDGTAGGGGHSQAILRLLGNGKLISIDQDPDAVAVLQKRFAANPNAFGYASLASVGDTVKVVSVSGVAPSVETVQDGSYVLQRPFVMVTKEGTELSEQAQSFLDFATSTDAASLIELADAVAPQK